MRSKILVVMTAMALSACSATASQSPWATSAAATATPAPIATPTPEPTPTPVPTPALTTFTLMDFNIEYGGLQIDFAKIVEAATLADADVIALEEATGNTQRLADEAGFPFASARHQLISRFPIIDPPGANGRYAFIELAPGAVVAVSNVHLPSDPYGPYDVRDGRTPEEVIALEEATRMPAIQERLDVLPALVAAGIPTFLTGDFNAPSHLDWTAAAVGLRPHVLYPLDWPVSKAIAAAGFSDSYRELHPDPVTHPGLTWWAARPPVDGYPDPSEPQDRIDIIYAAGAATPTEARIVGEVGGPQVDLSVDPWGTDHRAVVTTFTVSPGIAEAYVAVDERLVTVGEQVTVRFHGPADAAQLVSIDAVDTVVATQAIAAADGTWQVPTTGLAIGAYEVMLLAGDDVLARAPLSIAAVGARPVLAADEPSYVAGEGISVSWRDAPGSRWDWIGVYARGGDPLNDDYLFYVYTDQSVAGSVVIDETGEGEWPLPAGKYDAHYLLDDGYTSLASAPFTVTP